MGDTALWLAIKAGNPVAAAAAAAAHPDQVNGLDCVSHVSPLDFAFSIALPSAGYIAGSFTVPATLRQALRLTVDLLAIIVLCPAFVPADRHAILGRMLRLVGTAVPPRWIRTNKCVTRDVSASLAGTILRFMAAGPSLSLPLSVVEALCLWPRDCPQARVLALAVVKASDPTSRYMRATFPVAFATYASASTFAAVLPLFDVTDVAAYSLLTSLLFRHSVVYAYNNTAGDNLGEAEAIVLIVSTLVRRCDVERTHRTFRVKRPCGDHAVTYSAHHIPTAICIVLNDATRLGPPRLPSLIYWSTIMQNGGDPTMQLTFLTVSAAVVRARAIAGPAFPRVPADLIVTIMVRFLRMDMGAARPWHQYRGMQSAASECIAWYKGFARVRDPMTGGWRWTRATAA